MVGTGPLLLLLYAVPYGVRARSLRARGRPLPAWRIACFAGGLVLAMVALSRPVGALADRSLTAHMAEHLLIGDLTPLLIVLGCTGPLMAPVLRLRAAGRLRLLGHPLLAFAMWTADLYLWHLSGAYEAALHHAPIHVAQHACFFAFGANLWLALLGPLPKPDWFGNSARLGYVVGIWLAGAALGNAFAWSGTAFYPSYAGPGPGAPGDQGTAGALMMIEQTVVVLALFCWLFLKAVRDAAQRQELAELAGAHGVALDRRRLARAVAAGQGEVLRRRILGGVPPA